MFTQFSPSQLFAWADQQAPQHSGKPFHRIAHTICRVVLITIQEFRKNELSLRAAALTFTVMLSLVPILAMSTAVVKGLGGGDQLKRALSWKDLPYWKNGGIKVLAANWSGSCLMT